MEKELRNELDKIRKLQDDENKVAVGMMAVGFEILEEFDDVGKEYVWFDSKSDEGYRVVLKYSDNGLRLSERNINCGGWNQGRDDIQISYTDLSLKELEKGILELVGRCKPIKQEIDLDKFVEKMKEVLKE